MFELRWPDRLELVIGGAYIFPPVVGGLAFVTDNYYETGYYAIVFVGWPMKMAFLHCSRKKICIGKREHRVRFFFSDSLENYLHCVEQVTNQRYACLVI